LTNGAPPVLRQGFTATKVEEPNDFRNARCHDFNGECQIDEETLGLFAPISVGPRRLDVRSYNFILT
jgi:hypothetical protein